MFSLTKRDEFLELFNEGARAQIEENCTESLVDFMVAGNADAVKEYCSKVQSNIKLGIPEGLPVPKVSFYVASSGEAEAIDTVSIGVTSKYTSNDTFKFRQILTKVNCESTLADFLIGVYSELLVNEMAKVNIEKVNEVVGKAVEKSGVSYSVKVVSAMGQNGRKVSMISNEEVVFVADEERVFDLADILVFCEPDDSEYSRVTTEVIDNAITSMANTYATAQTTVEFVENRGFAEIRYLANISNQIKPMTLIKKVCSKNSSALKGNKDTLAYFSDGSVYSLIARVDGNYEVVLSPFDVSTFRFVEKDVLKEAAFA